MRTQGMGRYAESLLDPLDTVAGDRGGELLELRTSRGRQSSSQRALSPRSRLVRRPPLPSRAVEIVDQGLLPLDLLRIGPDLHHSLAIYGTPLLSPVPVVTTVHDVVPLQWPGLYLQTGLVHRLLFRAVRRAAAIVCPSSATRVDLLLHLEVDPDRVHVVPDAADQRFRPADPLVARHRFGLEGPYLLYVGSLDDPRKDTRGLVDGFVAWSREEDRSETLVLAGPAGDTTGELEDRARRAGARVVFAGFVPDADLPSLYSGASCLVSASRYEGFGLPILEALACGTPVVAFAAGAIPETAGPGALLVPPGDGVALMRAVAHVCDEAETAERLGGDGRRHAGRFSWRRTAELTWDVYERVLAGR